MPYVTSSGARIYYEAHGEGPAIVFAHGAGGNAASWWQQLPFFVDRYRLVVFDHRGFGRSTCDPKDFTARHLAGDVAALMDQEGIERAALVCQSMGGWAGSRLAVEQSERVTALVMSHTPGCFSNAAIRREAETHHRPNTSLGRFQSWATAPDFPTKNPAAAYLYTQLTGLSQFDRSLLEAIRVPEAFVDVATLTGYQVPTLFVSGLQDLIFPERLIEMVARFVPGARFESLGAVGHSSYFEAPDAFNQTVGRFLAQHAGG